MERDELMCTICVRFIHSTQACCSVIQHFSIYKSETQYCVWALKGHSNYLGFFFLFCRKYSTLLFFTVKFSKLKMFSTGIIYELISGSGIKLCHTDSLMTPVAQGDATVSLRPLRVMYSAHSKNTILMISSLMLNQWDAHGNPVLPQTACRDPVIHNLLQDRCHFSFRKWIFIVIFKENKKWYPYPSGFTEDIFSHLSHQAHE